MSRTNRAPRGSIIRSYASRSFSWKLALCEWIDNAFDAAKNKNVALSVIKIDIGKDHVEIQDNSVGTDKLHSMVVLGDHTPHDSTQIGEYGIGAKDAMLWIGGDFSTVSIKSTHKGIKRTLRCDWQDYAREWDLDDPVEEVARPGDIGTSITVTPRKRDVPAGQSWLRLVEDIGYTYSSALKKGAKVTISGPTKNAKDVEIVPWKLPDLDDVIDVKIDVNGKTARVYCGIVKPGIPNTRSGITYLSMFRVILPESAKGCGDHNLARVCGFVELGKGWKFSTNKDDIIGDAKDLFDEVERVIKSILVRGDSIGSELKSQAFESAVADILNKGLNAKAKRDPADGKGTHGRKNTARKHKDAAKKNLGSTMPGEEKPPLVVHAHLGDEKGIGEVKGRSVMLNLDNNGVRAAYEQQNVLATASLAASLISSAHCMPLRGDKGNQLALRVQPTAESFGQAMGALMNDMEIDGEKATTKMSLKVVA